MPPSKEGSATARRAGMSQRNFTRVFRDESEVTPAEFVEATRVELARRLLEDTARNVLGW
jgi:transcriptional regulator GlxA family with amidase domain